MHGALSLVMVYGAGALRDLLHATLRKRFTMTSKSALRVVASQQYYHPPLQSFFAAWLRFTRAGTRQQRAAKTGRLAFADRTSYGARAALRSRVITLSPFPLCARTFVWFFVNVFEDT